MSGDKVALQPAYLLHRRDYRETSLLVEAFTADHGRVGLVAKGAKRGGRWQGALQPFQPLLLSWSGRGELRTLTGAESNGRAAPLAGRLLFSGFYLNELLLKLLQREDPHPELFARYGETLNTLAQDEAWSLRLFERDLLRELGYGLLLESDTHGEPIDAAALYDYQVEQGPVRIAQAGPGHLAIHGESLLRLAAGVADDEAQRESKRLLRAVLAIYLNGRELASRALYRGATARGSNDEEEK